MNFINTKKKKKGRTFISDDIIDQKQQKDYYTDSPSISFITFAEQPPRDLALELRKVPKHSVETGDSQLESKYHDNDEEEETGDERLLLS